MNPIDIASKAAMFSFCFGAKFQMPTQRMRGDRRMTGLVGPLLKAGVLAQDQFLRTGAHAAGWDHLPVAGQHRAERDRETLRAMDD
ncbi:hypothetical protein K9B32_21240 [Rhizobium sp. 3T7]|uniref:hypothetical protein n=1 Tax=Rhizobium sp. 3T7 TaxID=2874922 RepID=UPI001CCA1AAA|nr:hypothetical protein [Rhizobium sp. 3T7]MBZ9792607.1 hypothetical protein [Rhizobium sp. 3T7]